MVARLSVIVAALLLAACGGGEPDFESCAWVNGHRVCCSTWCDGNKCETTCI